MKRKSKAVAKKSSQATEKVAKRRTVKQVRSRPIPTESAAANQDMFVAALGELVEISGDMRTLLVEIRDLLAEGAEQEDQAQEGVDTVIVAETEPEEDVELACPPKTPPK
jgi:hypothetical protein